MYVYVCIHTCITSSSFICVLMGHLSCFHVLATINIAVVNIGMHVFFELMFHLSMLFLLLFFSRVITQTDSTDSCVESLFILVLFS